MIKFKCLLGKYSAVLCRKFIIFELFLFILNWKGEIMSEVASAVRSEKKSGKRKNVSQGKTASAKNIKSGPPPYHLFTVLGEYFVFDTSTAQSYCAVLPESWTAGISVKSS